MAREQLNARFRQESQLSWRAAPTILLSLLALYLTINSLTVSIHEHLVPMFWDEWEMAKLLTADPSRRQILQNVFTMHGEHFIIPTKILLIIDYELFSLTNLPLIIIYFIGACGTGYLLSRLVYTDNKARYGRICLWLIFIAAGTSLVQWENTLWGFQSQLQFVEIGALGSLLLAVTVPTNRQPTSIWLGTALCLCVGFCIFSMGNGIFIVPSVALVLLTRQVHRRLIQAFVAASSLYVVAFLLLRSPMPSVGDPALRTASNFAQFFVAMIGGPVATDFASAIWAGVTLILVLASLFVMLIVVPVCRARPLDSGLFALFAFAGFLVATVGAASWARTPLGVGAALAPRYATPMLLLWMSIFAIVVRFSLTCTALSRRGETTRVIVLFAAASLVGWTNIKPNLRLTIDGFSAKAAQSGYFLVSGITDDPALKSLYPWPESIRPALAIMRERRLNMFARRFGLAFPDAIDIETVSRLSQNAICPLSAIDKIDRLSPNNWSVAGWATDNSRLTPTWIMAVDSLGRILGYTPPLAVREDVTRVIGAETGFKGFTAPVHLDDASHATSTDSISLAAVFADRHACRLKFERTLP